MSDDTNVATLSPGKNADELDSGVKKSLPSGDTLTALQGIIARQSARLDSLLEQAGQLTDSMRALLENDVQLSETQESLKEASAHLRERKRTLSASPESMQLKYKLQEVKEQVKDIEESLNNHLLEYYRQTDTKVFDLPDGGQREFVIKAKLLKKKTPAT